MKSYLTFSKKYLTFTIENRKFLRLKKELFIQPGEIKDVNKVHIKAIKRIRITYQHLQLHPINV